MARDRAPDVLNPYIAGNPVTGREMFFGREDVFAYVRDHLTGKYRDNVIVLYGQRRTGKTSVLYQMGRRLDARYLCVFVDLHGLALHGLGGFLWELANHIVRVLRRNYHLAPDVLPRLDATAFSVDPRSQFENDFLPHIWSVVGDRHLLLMLDEAIRLEEQVRAGKMEQEIFQYLRHLMQHFERLNFLFSLGSGLEEMADEYAFLFSVALYKKISFLDHDAAVALITQPVKECYQVEADAVERILDVTSGHAYYTQLLCHSLFAYWQTRQMRQLSPADVDAVLDEVIERGSAVLKHVWEESSPGEKAVMTGIAAAMHDRDRPVGAKEIDDAWAIHNVALPVGETAKAIQGLLARDVVVGTDEYTFAVDLQRLWVRRHRRPEWVREEVASALEAWSRETAPTLSEVGLEGGHVQAMGSPAREVTAPSNRSDASRRRSAVDHAHGANAAWRANARMKPWHRILVGMVAVVALVGVVAGVLVSRAQNQPPAPSPVDSVAFSPNSKTLASGSQDDTIRLWNVATRQPIGSPLTGHAGYVASVAFSPDGKTLASGSDDYTIRLWDVRGQKPLSSPLTGHTGDVKSVAFSPDGKTLASGSNDETIRLWNVATRQPIGSPLTGPTNTVYSVAFSPNGRLLASGSGGTIWLWDVVSRKLLGSPLTGHTDTVYSVAFSPNGTLLASGSNDRTIRLWDVKTRKPLGSPLRGPVGYVTSVAFSPNGTLLASGAEDGTIRLWSVAARRPFGSPLTSTDTVYSVAFSPNGKLLASGNEDGTIGLWDVATRRPRGPPLIAGS